MGPERGTDRDAGLAALAARQHGVVTTSQLLALGFTPSAVRQLDARRRLHRLHRGVYAVGHDELSLQGRRFAAVLACGDGAQLSHRAAGAARDVRPSSRARLDVTVVRTSSRPIEGVDVHVTRRLRDEDRGVIDGLPVTSVARTLADLAGVLRFDDLRRTLERAEGLQVLDIDAVLRAVHHRPGAPRVRAIFDEWAPAPTNRGLEERLLKLVRRSGLPEPHVNWQLLDFEVDLFWPTARLVVEADSRRFHDTAAAFERDRHRDAVLAAAGYRVVRFTWRQVTRSPAEVVNAIRAALHTPKRIPKPSL